MWLLERHVATPCQASALETIVLIHYYRLSLYNHLQHLVMDRSKTVHNAYISDEAMHVSPGVDVTEIK